MIIFLFLRKIENMDRVLKIIKEKAKSKEKKMGGYQTFLKKEEKRPKEK